MTQPLFWLTSTRTTLEKSLRTSQHCADPLSWIQKNLMRLRKKPLNLKYKTTIFSVETVKMYPCVELLMTLWSGKIFSSSYTMRMVIKDAKVLIDGWQIDISGIIYMQRSSLMYRPVRTVNAVTLFDLKKPYIRPG